jgi:hypothetical protein
MEATVVGESGSGGGGRALCLAAQRHLQIWTRSGQCVVISFWVLLAMEVVVAGAAERARVPHPLSILIRFILLSLPSHTLFSMF